MKKQKDFEQLSMNDILEYADGGVIDRGISYQKSGSVKGLAQSNSDTIIAWVEGTRTYAVEIDIDGGKLNGACTCPYYGHCKHQIAVVMDYLDSLKKGKSIPRTKADDERMGLIANDSEATMIEPQEAGSCPEENNQEKMHLFLQKKSKKELIQLVLEIADRIPESKAIIQFKEKLSSGEAGKLVKQLKRDIREISSEPGWSNHWSGERNIPDYSPVYFSLQELFDTGCYDQLLELGLHLLEKGSRQLEETDDEGETAEEIESCLEIVSRSLKESSMSSFEQMKWAFEFEMKDEFDLTAPIGIFWDNEFDKEDWSLFADYLISQLKSYKSINEHDYRRSLVAKFACEALENSGRSVESLELYKQEAIKNYRYEELVDVFIQRRQLNEARQWIIKGIEKTRKPYPGIAKALIEKMKDIAKESNNSVMETSIKADLFLDSPSRNTYLELKKAAQKLDIWRETQAGVFYYLENGKLPATWPVEESGLGYSPGVRKKEFPMINTIIEFYIEEKRPDEVYRWYQSYQKQKRYYFYAHFEDKIADSIQETNPKESILIWKTIAASYINQVKPKAYESALTYLRKTMNLLVKQKRSDEWHIYLNTLKAEHSRKSSLMKLLRLFDTSPIIRRN